MQHSKRMPRQPAYVRLAGDGVAAVINACDAMIGKEMIGASDRPGCDPKRFGRKPA
jgi:hypothetical protein